MAEQNKLDMEDYENQLRHDLIEAVTQQDMERAERFRQKYAGTVILAADLPHAGDMTLLHAEDLRPLLGTKTDTIGFAGERLVTTAQTCEPVIPTLYNIGRLSVVTYVDSRPPADYEL